MEEKKLEGFYSEEVLAEMLYHGEISRLSYVWHSTEQMRQDFLDFCNQKGLERNETAATLFMDYQLRQEEELHHGCNG